MKLAHSLILSQLLILSFSGLSIAQTQPAKITEEEKKDFVRLVKNTLFGACNQTAGIDDPRERSKNCICYANEYVEKFTFPTLVAINEWALRNPKRGIIIPLMMEKEMKKCGIKWSQKQ